MSANWTFGRKLAAGFAAPVLILVVVSMVGYRSPHSLGGHDRLVSHTHQVRRELAALLSLLKAAETGQRGFVITGNEAFLEPYQGAVQELGPALAHVASLTSDNDAQQ